MPPEGVPRVVSEPAAEAGAAGTRTHREVVLVRERTAPATCTEEPAYLRASRASAWAGESSKTFEGSAMRHGYKIPWKHWAKEEGLKGFHERWSGLPVLVNTKLRDGVYSAKWLHRLDGPSPAAVLRSWLDAGVSARRL